MHTQTLIDEIEAAFINEDDLEADEFEGSVLPCRTFLFSLIAAQDWLGVELPSSEKVRSWKSRYLKVWSISIVELSPKEGFKEKRLSVLQNTFDALIYVCEKEESEQAQ